MRFLGAPGTDDRDTHDRGASAKQAAAADRRIDIQPAEDEDGLFLIKLDLKYFKQKKFRSR